MGAKEKLVRGAQGLGAGYGKLLGEIKARVRSSQLRAAVSVNRDLIALYWEIGGVIVKAQKSQGYGKQVVERLAADLATEFPGLEGLSAINQWRMRAFHRAYSNAVPILSQAVTEFPARKLSQAVTESAPAPPAAQETCP